MQHVSLCASGVIISVMQTNTWHYFDLSICTLECGNGRTAEETVVPLKYYSELLKSCSSQAQLLIIYSKTWEAGSGRD